MYTRDPGNSFDLLDECMKILHTYELYAIFSIKLLYSADVL